MAVCRIEKTKDYTIMANHHLRNKNLSLKAKGLLSLMLSLPDNWDYTIKGLAYICKDGIDSINGTIKELESQGYISRQRIRNAKGQLTTAEYTIREQPNVTEDSDTLNTKNDTINLKNCPIITEPTLESPKLENPTLATPIQEEPHQLSTYISKTNLSNTDILNTHQSNPYQSYPASKTTKKSGYEMMGYDNLDELKNSIYQNIEYQHYIQHGNINMRKRLDEIADIIIETICSTKDIINISGDDYPATLVKEKLFKINSSHIEYVFECLDKNTTYIRNIKRYLLATLFNAPSTIDSYYTALVNHDIHNSNN